MDVPLLVAFDGITREHEVWAGGEWLCLGLIGIVGAYLDGRSVCRAYLRDEVSDAELAAAVAFWYADDGVRH